MFNCQICGKTTQPNEKQHKVVVEKRKKEYPVASKKNKNINATGFEIVKEINVCEECFKEKEGK